MVSLLHKPLEMLGLDDLKEFMGQGLPEGSQLEYKEGLPSKQGKDSWYEGGRQIGDHARNKLLSEVLAFANAYGGHLLIGIAESSTRPSIAESWKPIPRCAELAERLRLQARDCIEPQLPALHTTSIVTGPDDSGVVVVRVPRSRSAPHRLRQTLNCYYRRADRTEEMTMREIQELTLARARETIAVQQHFVERRQAFQAVVDDSPESALFDDPVNAVRVTLVPLSADVYTGPLFKHPRITNFYGIQKARVGGREVNLALPHLSMEARPMLRGVRYKGVARETVVYVEILENGIVDYWLLDVASESGNDALIPEWIMGLVTNAILAANRVRLESRAPEAEYGLEVEITRRSEGRINLGKYGSGSSIHVQGFIPNPTVYPRISFAGREEALAVLAAVERDIWNSVGHEPAHRFEAIIPDELWQ